MKHEIDLSNYEIRTDLAIDVINNIEPKEQTKDENLIVTDITLTEEEAKLIGKRPGNYLTIEFQDVTDTKNYEKVKKVFVEQGKKLWKRMRLKDDATILVVGLGNDKSTPDALGPFAIEKVIVTRHLYEFGNVDPTFRNVSIISPGVMGETGIETVSIIKGVVDSIHPDVVFVIDALKSGSIERVNKTIQITDTGIHPGSGVGNKRKEISKETLGVPVIAIGVPTVVDLVTIVSDTVKFMHQHFSYTKSNMNKPSHKLVPKGYTNYLKKKVEVNPEDKVALLGMLGCLSNEEIKELFFEVLTPVGYNLIVTPKEIDFLIQKLSDLLGTGLNEILHK